MSTRHVCTKVTLRQRAIRNEKISLYLDYYPAIRNPETMTMSRREYLGIYIYANPKNELERNFNIEMLNKAEAIRCLRVTSLINEEFGFLDKNRMRQDFLAYFKKIADKKEDKWSFVYQHFKFFVHDKCTFADITIEFCNKFRDYLLTAHSLKHTDKPLNQNSASAYWGVFRSLLKQAHRDKYLRENINDYLDRIEENEVKKEYLTPRRTEALGSIPLQNSYFEIRLFVLLPDRITYQRHSQSEMGAYTESARRRLLHPNPHTEDKDRSHPSHQHGSLRTMWSTKHWHGVQRIQAQHGSASFERMAEICWYHKTDVIPLLSSLLRSSSSYGRN